MGYRSLNFSRVGRAILIGISLLLLMSRNAWSQEAIDPKIQQYIEQLRDDIEENNLEASRRVKEEIGIDGMIQILVESDNQELRFAILEALGKIMGKIELGEKRREVIAVLINLLKTDTDEEVRNYVTYSLADMGRLAKDAINALIEAAKYKTDSYQPQPVRVGSIRALKAIAPYQLKTIQTYIDVQQDPNQYVRNLAVDYLSDILRNIDSDVLDQALEKVKAALKQDNDWQTRLGAAEALGRSGRDVQSAVSTLEKALKSNNEKLTPNVINALKKIAKNFLLHVVSLTREELVNAKKGLEKAIEILDDLGKPGENIEEIENNLRNALTLIDDLQPQRPKITEIFEKDPLMMGLIIIVILWFPLIFILLWIRPLWLLTIDKFLQSYTDIPLSNVLGGIKISTLRGLLFNLHYHPKVLDAWVQSKLEIAHHEFNKKKEDIKLNIYIPIPVYLNGKIITNFKGENLKSCFNEQQERLLIWGEGGLGKTSLAYQLGNWAMSKKPEDRICEHQMLPIL